jgi:hypothetical protein
MQYYQDEIIALKGVIDQTESLIALAQTDEERQIIRENEANAKLLLPVYEDNLAGVTAQQQELVSASEQALYFVREQNKLKKEQVDIDNQLAILNQKDALTQARGTIEQQRKSKLLLEEARLTKAIADIRLNTPEGPQRNELILGELRQSKVNKENIDFDAEGQELDLERKLLDLDAAIDDKKAGFLSRIGFNFKADKIRKDSAIAQEYNRYQKELAQYEKDFADQPDKLKEFKEKAAQLNQVNLEGINQQFKSLKFAVEDSGIAAIQGFFQNVSNNLFQGKGEQDKAYMEERLRYAEELVQLENQYREAPGHLAHLKNRARELNEEKLDKIKGEFNLFNNVVKFAGQALLEFGKQLAAMAAQQAAAKLIGSILDVGLGSLGSSKNFDGVKLNKAPKAFKADKGITVGDQVENFNDGGSIKDRKVSDRYTEVLRGNFPGIESAWQSEGEGAQLGVFHTNEELLSRKTGEAGRYQTLKARYGINPLKKIGVFASGGTIGDVGTNVLSSIGSTRPRIDLSGLKDGNRGQKAQASKNVTINTTVVTPNADSFRLNQDQQNQDLMERLRRGI